MLLLLLPLLQPIVHTVPHGAAVVRLQEPDSAPAAQEEEKKEKKKKFARLTSPMKKELQAGLRLLEKGEEEEQEIEQGKIGRAHV